MQFRKSWGLAQGIEIRVFGEACRRQSGIEGTLEEVECARDEPRVVLRPRQEREGAGGIVKALWCRDEEEAIDVGFGGGIAQPGAEQGAELKRVAEVGGLGERRLDLGQG